MPEDQIAALENEKYISLTTFRRDGRAVTTPVWFIREDDHLFVRTRAQFGKVKRIRNDPHVTIAPCTFFGKVAGGAFDATAHIVGPGDQQRLERRFSEKYGLEKRIIDLVVALGARLHRRTLTCLFLGLDTAGAIHCSPPRTAGDQLRAGVGADAVQPRAQ